MNRHRIIVEFVDGELNSAYRLKDDDIVIRNVVLSELRANISQLEIENDQRIEIFAQFKKDSDNVIFELRAEAETLKTKLGIAMSGRSTWTKHALDELDTLRAEVEALKKTQLKPGEVRAKWEPHFCGSLCHREGNRELVEVKE